MKVQAHRLIVALSLALAASAIVVSGAQADRPDDRAGLLGVGLASSTVGEQPSHPNDRAGMLGVGGLTTASVPDAFGGAGLRHEAPVRPDDRDGIRGPGLVQADIPSVTAISDDGFQWGDAAFGAGAAFGLVLLAAGATATIRYRRRVALS
jgi:hypothetical protein